MGWYRYASIHLIVVVVVSFVPQASATVQPIFVPNIQEEQTQLIIYDPTSVVNGSGFPWLILIIIYVIPLLQFDGGWSDWTPWSKCPVTCGGSKQERIRTCINPILAFGGKGCSGTSNEVQDCSTQSCPIDGGWTDWAQWDACTTTCGGGTQQRERSCTKPAPQFGGLDCVGDLNERLDCNILNCPIDGNWSDWTNWDMCSVSCGGGVQGRTRSCTNPSPQYGGASCVGDVSEEQDCNSNLCPIDGGWQDWAFWGTCSSTCGGGSQSRFRSCSNPFPQHGGNDCVGEISQTQDCNTQNC